MMICYLSPTCFRLQNSPYFCVFKYARAVKQNVWNEAENRERDWGETLKIRTVRFAYVIFVRIIRFSQPRAIPIGYVSMQVVTKLSSNVFNKSFALFPTVMKIIAKAFAVIKMRDVDRLDLLARIGICFKIGAEGSFGFATQGKGCFLCSTNLTKALFIRCLFMQRVVQVLCNGRPSLLSRLMQTCRLFQ